MKKIFALVFSFIMLMSFAGCGEKEEITEMPNPMKEMVSIEELCEAADCAMIRPEGIAVDDEAFFLIESYPAIAEYQFTVDGKNCVLRFADTDTDISGVFSDEGTLYSDYTDGETVGIQNDDLQSQRWFTIDGQYVFTVFDGGEWEWTQFNEIVSQFMSMEPRNWKSDVPFADYIALVGYYADADMNIAAVSIDIDHVKLNVAVELEDGMRMFWEMDAVLNSGKLVYEKEALSQGIYDDDGSMSSVSLPDGGAGCVEIMEDGSLDFSDAYSEELRDFVMAPYNLTY